MLGMLDMDLFHSIPILACFSWPIKRKLTNNFKFLCLKKEVKPVVYAHQKIKCMKAIQFYCPYLLALISTTLIMMTIQIVYIK